LPSLALTAGIGELHYKDESTRLGLGSFKALGGAYAVLEYLASELSRRLPNPVTMQAIRKGAHKADAQQLTIASATDGNHGRSVAWGAQQAGCDCKIYIHSDVSQGRADAIAAYGAEIIRVAGDYDDSVRQCAIDAKTNNWQVISDTSYPGYDEVPRQVMAGYTVMVKEILSQLTEPPTHVFIQAGVGGLAAAVCAAFWSQLGEQAPRFIIAESEHAACVIKSMRSGKPSTVAIKQETIMAGLSCGEISLLAWEILSKSANAVVTLPDDAVVPTMRVLAQGDADSPAVEAGECATPGIIALLGCSRDTELKEHLALNKDSRVLVFGCEGATDPELYEQLLHAS